MNHRTANRTGEDRSGGCPPILSLRGIPKILEEAKKRLAKYFEKPLDIFPELAKIRGGTRIQREERRWACLKALYAYLEYVQLAGMRVGEYQADGSFQGRLTAELLKISSLERARFYRAQRDLIDAGYVSSQQQRIQEPDGTWICLPAIRALNARVFAAVGLLPRLKHEMERATARLFKRFTREAIAVAQAAKRKVQRIFRAASKEISGTHRRLLALARQHPDTPLEELFALVKNAQGP